MDGYGGSNMFFPPGETGFGRGVGEDLHPHTRGRPERSLRMRGRAAATTVNVIATTQEIKFLTIPHPKFKL